MTYSAVAIANYFIQKGALSKRLVDPMKLQKLVYFAHGWHLAIHGRPLIDERVEAWSYGPVVPSIYHEVKAHGPSPIEHPISQLFEAFPTVTDPETLALLERIWEVYGPYTALDLSRMSHDPQGPWHKTWQEDAARGAIRGVDIPDDEIKRYFIHAAKKQDAA